MTELNEIKENKLSWTARTEAAFGRWSKKTLAPFVDELLKVISAVFFLAVSYLYVRDWLILHQIERDFSTAGSILAVSIATYLIVRRK